MNKGIFIGNLGRDADVKTIDGGMTVISFNLAIDESYKNKAGEKISKTQWVNCSFWKNAGQSTEIAKYLTKGSKVCVVGSCSSRAWMGRGDDPQPNSSLECKVIEVHLLGSKPQAGSTTAAPETTQTNEPDAFDKPPVEDDLPF